MPQCLNVSNNTAKLWNVAKYFNINSVSLFISQSLIYPLIFFL